jgi:hypothetical protein
LGRAGVKSEEEKAAAPPVSGLVGDPAAGVPSPELRKPSLAREFLTSDFRRQAIDLPLIAGGIVAGGAVAGPGGAAVGAGLTMTAGNLINAYIDQQLEGTQVDYSRKAVVKDAAWNIGMNLGFDALLSYMPAVIGFEGARASVKEGERATGMVLRDRQEYLAKSAAERETTERALQEKHLERVTPQARQELLYRETGGMEPPGPYGATPARAGAAAAPEQGPVLGSNIEGPTQDALIQQGGLRGTYYNIRKGTFKTLGDMYQTLMGGEVKTQIGEDVRKDVLGDVADTVKNQGLYAKETRAKFKGGVPRLISLTKRVLRDKDRFPLDEADMANIGQKDREMMDEASGLSELAMPSDVEHPILGIDPKTGTSITTRTVKAKPTTIGDLYYMMRLARKTAAEAPDAESARVADSLSKSYEQALEKAGVSKDKLKQLKILNNNYRSAMLDFPWEVGEQVSKGKNPMEISDALFSDPQRTARIFRNASTEQRAMLKENFGNWGSRNWNKMIPSDVATNPAHAEELARHYGDVFGKDSPFAKPKSLAYIRTQLEHLDAVPGAKAEFERGFDEDIAKEAHEAAGRDAKFGLGLLRKLGPVGHDTARAVEAAKTPEEAAKIVDDYFNKMSPRDFRRLIGEKESVLFPGKMVGNQMGMTPVSEEAGVGPYAMYMIKRQGAWPWFVGTAILSGLPSQFAHVSPFWGMVAAGSTLFAGRRSMQGVIVKGLTSETWEPIMSNLSNGAYRASGNSVAKALMYQATQHAIKYGVPIPGTDIRTPGIGSNIEPEPDLNYEDLTPVDVGDEDKTTSMIDKSNIGPMARDVERKQATQIATERGRQDSGHIDQVQELHSQVAQGEVPDIHQDLASGRLSNEEVRKMLADRPRDPSALFHGMNLADAVDAFSKGTDMEKSLSLQALAQKIQNEGQNLQPVQRRALMAQLQRALGESQAA